MLSMADLQFLALEYAKAKAEASRAKLDRIDWEVCLTQPYRGFHPSPNGHLERTQKDLAERLKNGPDSAVDEALAFGQAVALVEGIKERLAAAKKAEEDAQSKEQEALKRLVAAQRQVLEEKKIFGGT